jgi:hypothetical protein
MIFAVSMTSGVDHDRVEGAREAIVPRMSEMMNVTEAQADALLYDASLSGSCEYQADEIRAWIKQVH